MAEAKNILNFMNGTHINAWDSEIDNNSKLKYLVKPYPVHLFYKYFQQNFKTYLPYFLLSSSHRSLDFGTINFFVFDSNNSAS